MKRIAIGVEYWGGDYEGWQTQPHGRTVQDRLEEALSHVAGEPVATACAGRTDTGVHATAQVAHFDIAVERPLSAWVRGCNSVLPPSIAVRWAVEVSATFHARFSAQARSYRYLLVNQPVRPALLAGRAGWFHLPLDVAAMQDAAARLRGEHDFSAFRAASCQAHSPVRTLSRAEVRREGDLIAFDFTANGFLHHMVRNLVGSLVYVGKGKHPPGWIDHLLQQRDRSQSAPTFAPDGLYLCGIDYGDGWPLPGGGRIIAPPQLPFPV